jgi:hypothetical protein
MKEDKNIGIMTTLKKTYPRKGPGGGPYGRQRVGRRGFLRTQGARGLGGQALDRLGCVSAGARGRAGCGLGGGGRSRHAWRGPGEVHHDAEPHDGQESEVGIQKG